MRKFLIILFGFVSHHAFSQQVFTGSDVDRFWQAYDKITATKDTVSQYRILHDDYLNQATPGLQSLIEVRRYTDKDYIDAIRNYPKFWQSIRKQTLGYKKFYREIESDINQFKKLYPDAKPATVYFAIGAFRTNGTTQHDRILIGSECALADDKTFSDELPEWRRPFYKESNQQKHIALLCTHEFVHTQQKPIVENLLSSCLYEGVAEFLSSLATRKKSNVSVINFGKANEKEVIAQFVKDLYVMTHDYNWIWGENRNQFKVRDLGYYIGYEICERYYNQSADKAKAAKELVELDYNDEAAVEKIVDASHLLPKKVSELYADYEKSRPAVVSVAPFENGSPNVKPGKTSITITFSEPLAENTGVDFGPLGQSAFPKLSTQRKWSDDRRSWTIEADLEPNRHYQIVLSNNFRKPDQTRLKPYLIDFRTSD